MSKPAQPGTQDDPQTPQVASSALDFLLIELVPLVQRVTEQLQAREQALVDEYRRSKIFSTKSSNRNSVQEAQDDQTDGVVDGDTRQQEARDREEGRMTVLGFPEVQDAGRESMFSRLDSIGYRVGQGLVER